MIKAGAIDLEAAFSGPGLYIGRALDEMLNEEDIIEVELDGC
jgi:hypothetical protein